MRKDSLYVFGFFSFIASLVLISVYYIEFTGLAPKCELCSYQRAPYFVILAISAIVYLFPKLRKLGIALLMIVMLVSTAIAFFHVGVENKWFQYHSTCTATDLKSDTIAELKEKLEHKQLVSCEDATFAVLDISLAAWNFVVSAMMLFYILIFMLGIKRVKKYSVGNKKYSVRKRS